LTLSQQGEKAGGARLSGSFGKSDAANLPDDFGKIQGQ
jgi:hypothetical protein